MSTFFQIVKALVIGILICVSIIFFLILIFIIDLSDLGFFIENLEKRQQIMLKDPVKSVQDSMITLRKICESVESEEPITNCLTIGKENILLFRGKQLGKLDTVSIQNEGFKGLKKGDREELLSLVKFLNRNYISGVYHDRSIGFWLYPYRSHPKFNDIDVIRTIYVWSNPGDTLKPAFTYYFSVLDRKERMVLVSHNDVGYRRF